MFCQLDYRNLVAQKKAPCYLNIFLISLICYYSGSLNRIIGTSRPHILYLLNSNSQKLKRKHLKNLIYQMIVYFSKYLPHFIEFVPEHNANCNLKKYY